MKYCKYYFDLEDKFTSRAGICPKNTSDNLFGENNINNNTLAIEDNSDESDNDDFNSGSGVEEHGGMKTRPIIPPSLTLLQHYLEKRQQLLLPANLPRTGARGPNHQFPTIKLTT